MQAICKHCGLVGTVIEQDNKIYADYKLTCDSCKKKTWIRAHELLKNISKKNERLNNN